MNPDRAVEAAIRVPKQVPFTFASMATSTRLNIEKARLKKGGIMDRFGLAALIIFGTTTVFWSGYQYALILNVQTNEASDSSRIKTLETQMMPLNEQMARQSQLLEDIRRDLYRIEKNQRK